MSVASATSVDRLVLSYLKRRRLTETGKVLGLELRANGMLESGEAEEWTGEKEMDEGALLEALALDGVEPTAYSDAYTQFEAWVDASLDIYKPELSRLLYPLLVQAALALIERGAAGEAHALLTRHAPRFTSDGSELAARRASEVQSLLGIGGPEALAGNRQVAWRDRRVTIPLSAYPRSLLLHVLRRPSLQPVLGLVSGHIKLEDREGGPASAAEAAAAETEDALSGGGGSATEEQAGINTRAIELRLLSGTIEGVWALRRAEAAEQEAETELAEAESEAQQITKKWRAVLSKAAADARAHRENLTKDLLTDSLAEKVALPLPVLATDEAAMLADAFDGRVAVHRDALPSALLCTFVNTYASLNAAAVATDATLVVGGFADGSARFHDLLAEDQNSNNNNSTTNTTGSQPTTTTLRGHESAIYGIALSPDAKLALSAGGDGTARLWSRELGLNLVAWRAGGPGFTPVWDVCWFPATPSGHYFATGGADHAVKLWSVERSRPLRLFAGHGADISRVSWHPNAQLLISGSDDRAVRLWDLKSPSSSSCVRLLTGHKGAVTAITASPDGRTVAIGDAGGEISLWDLATAKRRAVHAGPRGAAVWSLAWSRPCYEPPSGGQHGSILAAGYADAAVRLWDPEDSRPPDTAKRPTTTQQQEQQPLATFRTKATPVIALEFSDKNLLLGAGGLALYRPQTV